jgi:hypothetical protein
MCYPDEMPEPIDDPVDPEPSPDGSDHPDGVPYEGELL